MGAFLASRDRSMLGVLKRCLSVEGMNANAAAYHARYIKTGSFAPVLHVMGGMFAIGYSLEHSHLQHAEHERLKAEFAKVRSLIRKTDVCCSVKQVIRDVKKENATMPRLCSVV